MLINEEPKLEIEDKTILALCDEKALNRIFINLFQNIIKHKGRNIEIKMYTHEEKVYILFSNDSEQISKEDIQRLFDRFYVADKNRSTKKSGLDLTIVKALVEAMDGSVSAELVNNRLIIKIIFLRG